MTREREVANAVKTQWMGLARDHEFAEFQRTIHSIGDVILLGGFARDVALEIAYGRPRTPSRDIDVIVASANTTMPHALERWLVRENRFGGLKLRVSGVSLDVWRLEDTWAFRSGAFRGKKDTAALPRTVLTWRRSPPTKLGSGRRSREAPSISSFGPLPSLDFVLFD
jgi:hypothetical protein